MEIFPLTVLEAEVCGPVTAWLGSRAAERYLLSEASKDAPPGGLKGQASRRAANSKRGG